MRIFVYGGNHQNSSSIADTVRFLKHALDDCGHDGCIESVIVPGQVHIILEHFVDEESVQSLIQGHAQGARYILIGTEPIVGDVFNGGVASGHWHYDNQAYWKTRFNNFLRLAPLADAIWVLAECMVADYRRLLPGKTVRFLPHGYVNGHANVQERPAAQQDIDFYFSGTMTDHRRNLLRRLARDHTVVHNHHETPEYQRLDQLSRSKVCLSLRLSPGNRIPSVTRMHHLLHNRKFFVQEAYELASPLDPYVLHAPSGEVVEWAIEGLKLATRGEVARKALARLQADLPMTLVLPPLLEEALSSPQHSRPLRLSPLPA